MTKPASSAPRGDKPVAPAPPPPPAWRHWLWAIAIGAFIVLYLVLPTTSGSQTVTLTYTQFLNDVNAKQVQTATIGSDGTTSGNLKNGKQYTTVIPVSLAGSSLLTKLENANVKITATT